MPIVDLVVTDLLLWALWHLLVTVVAMAIDRE